MQDDDVVEGGGGFEEVDGVEEGVGVGEEVVAIGVGFCAGGFGAEDEGRYCVYRISLDFKNRNKNTRRTNTSSISWRSS